MSYFRYLCLFAHSGVKHIQLNIIQKWRSAMTAGASYFGYIKKHGEFGGMRHFTICRGYKVAAFENHGELRRHETFYNM